MKKDIQRTINIFSVANLIFTLTLGTAASILNQNMSINIQIAVSIWMIVVVLLPSMYFLKVSPFKINGKSSRDISGFETIVLILLFWSFYSLIRYGAMVSGIGMITTGADRGSLGNQIVLGLIVPIIEELIYRGILLKQLREYGDGFAIIITSIIFSIAHYQNSIIVIFASFMLGIIYVLSNDLKMPIIFHVLINSSNVFLEGKLLKTLKESTLFFGIIFILCIIIIFFNKSLKQLFLHLRLNNIKEQFKIDKEKYSAAFRSEWLIIYLGFIGINTILNIMGKLSSF